VSKNKPRIESARSIQLRLAYSSTLKMMAISCFETSMKCYRTIRSHIQEDNNDNSHHSKKLRFENKVSLECGRLCYETVLPCG
jgi:hypothetical protein